VAFVAWALRVREPLIDLGLFRHRTYAAANAATLSFGIAFAIMFFAFFFYMGQVWHYSPALAGLAIAPGPLTVIPVAIVTGGSPAATATGRSWSVVPCCMRWPACGSCWCRAPSRPTWRIGCRAC
jgi:hypothetical protein